MSYIYVSFILPAHGKTNIRDRATIRYLSWTLQEKKKKLRDLYTQHWLRARHYIHMLQHSFFWSFLLITNANGTDAYTTWILFPGGGDEETQARRNTSEKMEEKGEGGGRRKIWGGANLLFLGDNGERLLVVFTVEHRWSACAVAERRSTTTCVRRAFTLSRLTHRFPEDQSQSSGAWMSRLFKYGRFAREKKWWKKEGRRRAWRCMLARFTQKRTPQ